MTLCIGLTGGIGCGKSTVAGLFAGHGAGIIDTDTIAHWLTQSHGDAIASISKTFGDDYIMDDGALDRSKMRRLIFSNPAAKQRLESILHPLILEQATAELQLLRTKPYVVIVVPLLAEGSAFCQLVQRVLVVDCDEKVQISRVIGRSNMSEAEVRDIIAQQSTRKERLQMADDVIHNDAGLDTLAEQVSVLHQRYSGMQNID
ncbi:MAG TPA: dephospho-CoA kinase [Gallionella sp.]|nr:dephospho-CoA kinase [Gallionella sp.]